MKYDNGIWKVEACRALAMTGIIENIYSKLKVLRPKQVDSIIALPKNSYKLFKSKEEYNFMLGNAGLVLTSDYKLIEHFKKNKSAFDRLKNELLLNKALLTTGVKSEKGKIYQQMHLLFIDNIRQDVESNRLSFLIGGMIDNTVGYLYIKDKKEVPDMSPEDYIMIKEIGDGWYLYKTT